MQSESVYSVKATSPDTAFRPSVTVVIREFNEEDEGRYFVAECLEIPGCVSQGDTVEEAQTNFNDALNACLNVITGAASAL